MNERIPGRLALCALLLAAAPAAARLAQITVLAERGLLPEDAERYLARARSEQTARRFAR